MKYINLKNIPLMGELKLKGYCPTCKAKLYNWSNFMRKLDVSNYICENDHTFEVGSRSLDNVNAWKDKINPPTTSMYRPVNDKELQLIVDLEYNGFPPRLPEQPIFYPVMNKEYAERVNKWNLDQYGVGFITKFEVRTAYLESFEVQNVGSFGDNEIWVPAEKMDEFNVNIIGKIKVLEKD